MKEAQIIRGKSTDQGTPGKFWTEVFECFSLELPWKDNKPDVSCIPAGEYLVVPYTSSHLGKIYKICDVPGRTDERIHVGNWAGDASMGYKSDSLGCIFLGLGNKDLDGQMAVNSSKAALEKLKEVMNYEAFKLKIVWQEEL